MELSESATEREPYTIGNRGLSSTPRITPRLGNREPKSSLVEQSLSIPNVAPMRSNVGYTRASALTIWEPMEHRGNRLSRRLGFKEAIPLLSNTRIPG